MNLQEALAQYSSVRAFRVGDRGSDDYPAWDVRPVDTAILSERDGYFIVKAKNTLPDGRIRDCYIDLSLPERISDYAYLVWCGSLDVRYHHEFGGEIICAVPIDCFGQYDLFYSRIAPDIGIDILREGLAISARKKCIAQDLGYMLRDEGRFREAAEAFQCAVEKVLRRTSSSANSPTATIESATRRWRGNTRRCSGRRARAWAGGYRERCAPRA